MANETTTAQKNAPALSIRLNGLDAAHSATLPAAQLAQPGKFQAGGRGFGRAKKKLRLKLELKKRAKRERARKFTTQLASTRQAIRSVALEEPKLVIGLTRGRKQQAHGSQLNRLKFSKVA